MSATPNTKPKSNPIVRHTSKWTPEEDEILGRAVAADPQKRWKKIAKLLKGKSCIQCLRRWEKVLNPAIQKGPWTDEEDAKLVYAVTVKGSQDWSAIASEIPGRIGKQCRERWFNHLHPGVRKDPWTPEEDRVIIEAHAQLGNEWTSISKLLDGRPANAVKNHWNATLKRQVQPEMRGNGRSPVVGKRAFNDEYTSKVSTSVPANLRRSARPKKRRNFDFSDDEEEESEEWSFDNPASSGSLTHELKEEKQQEKADAFSVAESILSLFAMATAPAIPLQPAEQSPTFANSYSSPLLASTPASTPALALADSQSSSSNDSVSKCSLRFLVSNENPAKHQRISAPEDVQAEQSFVFSFQ